MAERLSLDAVRHVARLARLKLGDRELELYRGQLASVLDHIARLERLDVENVEPMPHAHELTNRLDPDEVAPSLPAETVAALAPAVEEGFIAVPKVLGDAEGEGTVPIS